jgi:hypothetical protein
MMPEELTREVRKIERRRKAGIALTLVGVLACIAEIAQFLPGDPADRGALAEILIAALALTALLAGIALLAGSQLPAAARTRDFALLRAEAHQSKRERAFLLIPLSLLFLSISTVSSTVRILHGDALRHIELFSIGAFLFFLAAFTLLLAGRGMDQWAAPVLDDELNESFRSRAFRLGYLILLPGVALLFVVGLVDRTLALELSPLLAALGVAASAARLYWLERAATADAAQ